MSRTLGYCHNIAAKLYQVGRLSKSEYQQAMNAIELLSRTRTAEMVLDRVVERYEEWLQSTGASEE